MINIFKDQKSKTLVEIEPKINTFIEEVKKSSAFELKRKEFFDLVENYPVNLETLNKIIENEPEEFKMFITKELKHVITLVNKNKTIDEIEEKIKNALANYEISELENLQSSRKERNLAINAEIEAQIGQLYAEIEANPNFIADRQAELKKNVKGGKPKAK